MLIRFRFLAAILATLPAVALVVGCSKQREEPPAARTKSEISQRKTADQQPDASRHSNRTAPSNESQKTAANKNSGDSKEVNPFDQPGSDNGLPGRVSAHEEDRAISTDAGGTNGQTVGKMRSRKGATPSSGSAYTTNGDPDYIPPSDPRAAQAAAEQAFAAAEKAARSNDYGTAYRRALTGWQQANTYSKQDVKCRELAQTLLTHLERYGEKSNQSAGVVEAPSPSYKTLILK